MDFVPWTSFNRIVAKYRGDRDTRTLRCTEHFRVMAFAQITYRESLRDIEACLGAQPSKLCSMGLREPVAKSTLADANELRDWRMWSDLAAVLIKRARKLYVTDDFGLDLANTGCGTFFQMDKAESAHQTFLRHVRERGENTNLDRGVRLRARGNHKKGTGLSS